MKKLTVKQTQKVDEMLRAGRAALHVVKSTGVSRWLVFKYAWQNGIALKNGRPRKEQRA